MVRYPIFFEEQEVELLAEALVEALDSFGQDFHHVGHNYSDGELRQEMLKKMEEIESLLTKIRSYK